MAKTRLTQEKRSGLIAYMIGVWEEKNGKFLIELRAAAMEEANNAVRNRYPESDMKVLERYNLTRIDACLRFVTLGSSDVFGCDFDDEEGVVNIPKKGGCNNGTVFEISDEGAEIVKSFVEQENDYKNRKYAKEREYRSFLEVCRYVEDVESVVPLSEEMRKRYMSGAPLVALNPELVEQIREEFAA